MKRTIVFLAGLAAVAACAKGEQDGMSSDTAAMGQTAAAAAPTPASATPTDPQIAAIVVAANNVDIEGGRMAASKSTNAKVKAFAQRMITDHSGVNKAATDLVKKLGVTPEESDASRAQTAAGQTARQSLEGKTGAEFDRAYIANEVTYHQNLLNAIDQLLLPSVQNAELKALLDQTRPAVVAHLKLAQDLQAELGR